MADPSAVQIYIGGHDLTHASRITRVRIDDVLNDAPNTAALTVVLTTRLMPSSTAPFAPHAFDAGGFNTSDGPLVMTTPAVDVGAPIGIFLNGGADQIYGGEVLTREQYAEFDQPKNVRVDVTCTDFTRRLNYRKVSKEYATASATAIVLDMIATFAPTIGTAAVQAGLPSLSGGITFTFEDVSRALSRIAEKIGAYWYVDYAATLHFFTGTEAGATPAPIVPGGRFADLKITADLSQVRTRVFVEGDGGTIALTLPAGDVILPVSQTVPFNPAGGLATLGPWRVTYTGIHAGGVKTNTTGVASGGSGAGPPPSPPGAPTATLAAPSNPGGLAGGPYYYRVTFELSDGSRSDVGAPAGPITITAAAAPPATSSSLGANPSKGPIAVGVQSSYATSFVAADGKETAATLGGNVLTGRAVADAPNFPLSGMASAGNLAPGWYYWLVTYLTPAGETLGTLTSGNVPGAGYAMRIFLPQSSDGRVVGRRIYRSSVSAASSPPGLPWRHVVDVPNNNPSISFDDGTADANLPTKNYPVYSTATDVGEAATVNVPTSADARVTKRRLYRKDGPGAYRLVAEIPDNATPTFNDVVVGPGGDLAPTVNAIGSGAVSLSNIAIGPAGTVRRRVFRTAANGSNYRELVSLEDNSTTAYLDAILDSNLGGAPQPPQGTPAVAGSIPPTPPGQNYIQVENATGFPSSGWILLESASLIRYTNIDTVGGYLGGIPPSGPGSITAEIPNGSIVTLNPALVGVSPVLAVTLGDAVQLLAQVDDVPAQTALAAIEGGDGIIEHYIQDRRLSQAGAQARGSAELALFKTVETQLSYTTHDVETKSGRTVHVALPSPTNVTGDFLIQRVTIDDVSIAANWYPKRKVQASTTRFSFDDVLNRILLEQH